MTNLRIKRACEPDTVLQLKSLKSRQKSVQKARKEFHNEFYEEEEVPPLPPPLPIMQLMSTTTTTTVPVTTMQNIIPTTNDGHHAIPTLSVATLPPVPFTNC